MFRKLFLFSFSGDYHIDILLIIFIFNISGDVWDRTRDLLNTRLLC